MKEIKNWNGHHVLAISFSPNGTLNAVEGLARDLTGRSGACELCPARDTTKSGGCTNPKWYLAPPEQGGCRRHFVIAEEYIPLVRMRIGGPDGPAGAGL